LIADLSSYEIKMDASFTGARLLLFGARNEGGDVVVVVRGPVRDFIVRRKQRVAGVWMSGESVVFTQIPQYYAVFASKPLAQVRARELLRLLGLDALDLLEKSALYAKTPVNPAEFRHAFLSHQRASGLYREETSLRFMGETLFKTILPFPDTILEGEYTAEVYLLSAGELASLQTVPITVKKSGLDAAVYHFAHKSPGFYGVTAVAVALLAGWAASRAFERI
jgi:uncharacterized protein (TIGR02186 family)